MECWIAASANKTGEIIFFKIEDYLTSTVTLSGLKVSLNNSWYGGGKLSYLYNCIRVEQHNLFA